MLPVKLILSHALSCVLISIHGMFMFGSDNDKIDIFKKTSTFLKNYKIPTAHFYIFTPPPGSKIYKNYKNKSRILTNKWKYYDAQHVVFKPKNMTKDQLLNGVIDLMKEYTNIKNTLFLLNINLKNFILRLLLRNTFKKNIKYMLETKI